VAELPWPTVKFVNPSKRLKVGAMTVMLSGTDEVAPAAVPVMIALYCPRAAVLEAVRVMVADPGPLPTDGEIEAVTPLGSPEME
jgi:hypothetical protein